MTFDYDALYAREADALGPPTPALTALFDALPPACDVLDIGCGQGRDALPLARAGHRVTAVDLSPAGIRGLAARADAEGLDITSHAVDLTAWTPAGDFDVLLSDRTLHMLDDEVRRAVLARLIGRVREGGRAIIADEASNMAGLRRVFAADVRDWACDRIEKGLLVAAL